MDEQRIVAGRRNNLRVRAEMLQAVRLFFIERDYLEVETPIRVPTLAPESHIDAVSSGEWFLQTSPELCMKRLLAAGYDRIFQISKCFRGAERGSRHVPEFTLLEWYRRDAGYEDLMDECEDLLLFVSGRLGRGTRLRYRDEWIGLARPWERISVRDAFLRFCPVPVEQALDDGSFDELMVTHIEPRIGRGKPVFLYDYPTSLGALARKKQSDPTVAERFELYLGGLELANAFSELTEVAEQRDRFRKEEEYRRKAGKTPYPPAEKFLRALERMPESAGIALGIDRLAMIFADATSIDNVLSFTPEML
ncbi:MAG: EF-P lysine aminoacylase GenX [Deltaproteobacteria bacterium]|nr:EF-P lysine aminoacylase GenX [Deltaproteobacteria bacterium]